MGTWSEMEHRNFKQQENIIPSSAVSEPYYVRNNRLQECGAETNARNDKKKEKICETGYLYNQAPRIGVGFPPLARK